jgi:gas vesicle protein
MGIDMRKNLYIKSNNMSNSKLLVGFLVGAAVGGALGILLAPDKGEETRKKILEKGSDLGDSLSDFSDTIKDKFNEVVDGVKGNFSKAKNSMS